MPLLSLLRSPSAIFLLLRLISRTAPAEAGLLSAPSDLVRRYYHRKVVLDENKHHEEFFSFVTRPDLDAPKWDITVYDEEALTPGYWFTAPYSEVQQEKSNRPWNAPQIYDGKGDLIWSGAPMFNGFSTFDFRVQNVRGRDMLTLIYPHDGKAVIFDENYNIYKELHMGDRGLANDVITLNMHEFATADNGTRALYLTQHAKFTSKENSEVVGYDGNCYANYDAFREIDMETWEPTYTWDSENHIGLWETYVTQEPIEKECDKKQDGAYEFLHTNSIDKFPNGDWLVSGRRTNTVYRVSHQDGSIVWRLGGRKSDFKLPTVFSGQHAAKVRGFNDTHTLVSFLDNAYGPGDPQITNEASRGLLLSLDHKTMEAEVVMEYKHPNGTGSYAEGRGNMDMLDNGNAWICWVEHGLHSEHAVNGSLIMEAKFRAEIGSYRSFKLPWVGKPSEPPDVRAAAVEKNGDMYTIVHVSWNGATEVHKWRVYHTDASGGNRELKATTKKYGFETAVWTKGYASHVVVQARDKEDNVLGESYVFPTIATHDELNGDMSSPARWLQMAIGNPLVTFFSGMLGCLFAGGVTWGLWSSLRRRSFTWRGRRPTLQQSDKDVYEPLFEGGMEDADANADVDADGDYADEVTEVGEVEDEKRRLRSPLPGDEG